MFTSMNFVFDDIPSERYNLKIGFTDGSGLRDTFAGISQSIEEVKIKRVDKPIFLGVETTGKIEFELTLFSEEELDTYDRQAIDRWLFQKQYKFFQIEQEDYNGLFFNAIIESGSKVEIGNIPYAKKIMIICDSPYVYTDEYTSTYNSPTTFNMTNLSNLNDYYYPEMTITRGVGGTSSILNTTEGRTFEITGMSASEVLEVDNERKILLSSSGLSKISDFNKKWFRLLPDDNTITLVGDFELQLKIRYRKTI